MALRLAGGDQAEADDLVQDCWVRAVRVLSSFRAESALRTWLCGLLVNVRRERIRSNWRMVELLDADSPAAAASDGPPVDLERAIAALPSGARDVFVLHDVYGYKHREIAHMLEIATGTSKSQLTRARALLRSSLYAEGRS
jgi:RNA polymerase sigma-70 factor, ECF subfamily